MSSALRPNFSRTHDNIKAMTFPNCTPKGKAAATILLAVACTAVQISRGAETENARTDRGVMADGVETFPYIEATEVTPKGEFSDVRTIRTYSAGAGDTMLVSSLAFVVPWAWGERELQAFCRPTFKVTEGELLETSKDWWEEASRTNYPCIALGSKIMINRKISTVKAERGVITTVSTRRQPVRAGNTVIIPDGGSGERFLAVILRRGENAVVSCGEVFAAGEAQTGEGNTEHRWKAVPDREVSIQTFQIQ
jgi:hypothetical protein